MFKHRHLTPLCLQGLIKEEKLEKILIQHTHTKWLAKKKRKVVIALLTRRAQNC